MKKRLMAFLLAVVTTVGSLPTAPVFAAEDVEEVVVEEAGEVAKVSDLDTMSIVSKNGSAYVEVDEEGLEIVSGNTVSISVNMTSTKGAVSADKVEFGTTVEITSGTAVKITNQKDRFATVSGNNKVYTTEDIQVKADVSGNAVLTFRVVSKNGTEWVPVSTKATKTLVVKVVSKEEANTEENNNENTDVDPKTPDKTPSENKSESENKAEEEVIDYEALAEAKKDAEGMTAFTQIIDIDPNAQFQSIEMVAKQSFQNDLLKGYKSTAKKVVAISKKGKVSAKKAGFAELQGPDGKIVSVNVIKPTVDKKLKVEGGKTETIKINLGSTSLNVVFVSSDPAKASVSYDSAKREAYVTGIVKGSVTVTAYVNGKTYKTKVKVTSSVVNDYVAYINKGAKKSLSYKGVKKWVILDANGTATELKGKKKFIAGDKAGIVSINGLGKKDALVVSGNLIVQDLTLSLATGKSASVNGVDVNAGNNTFEVKKAATGDKAETYAITVKLNEVNGIKTGYAKLAFNSYAQGQPVVFKSSKAANVYMNGNGVIVAKKAYKKPITLSAKVNKKTIKIKVTVVE